jgi:DNA polymerase III gamma/tau subunit
MLIDSTHIRAELLSLLEKTHNIKPHANADFFDRTYEVFTIDDAREVKTFHHIRPMIETGKKIVLLHMNGITIEAQNALLKLLEEPAEYAHFFLIIPSAHMLLPTVKSRMRELKISKETKSKKIPNTDTFDPEVLKLAQKIISVAKAKRLEEVKKLVDDIAKEKKTKQDAIDLLNAIQAVIYETQGIKKGKSALETIEFSRNYIHDRAPSVKMLLEYVMLNV